MVVGNEQGEVSAVGLCGTVRDDWFERASGVVDFAAMVPVDLRAPAA